MFWDAIHYKVRQEGAIVNKAAYMVIGIDLDGRKDVLEMWIGEHETSKFWLVVLNELRNRGVQDILICCVDNLKAAKRFQPVFLKLRFKNASFIKFEILFATFPTKT